MQIVTKDVAHKRMCPFKVSGDFCVSDRCMSWRFGEQRKIGVDADEKDKLKSDGWAVVGYEVDITGATFTMRKILDKGYCGVAGLPGETPKL